MAQKLKNYFIAGLLVLAPIFLTLIIIRYIVRLVDGLVVNPVFQLFPFDLDESFKVLAAKSLIAVLVFLFVCFIGFFARQFIFKQVFSMLDGFLKNIPFFSHVYRSMKEVAEAFFGDKSGLFKRVVFVEYPRKGIYAMGFVTYEKPWSIHEITGQELLSIFVPAPPNPATGNFIFVPRQEVLETSMTIEEGIRLVISGGASVPK